MILSESNCTEAKHVHWWCLWSAEEMEMKEGVQGSCFMQDLKRCKTKTKRHTQLPRNGIFVQSPFMFWNATKKRFISPGRA